MKINEIYSEFKGKSYIIGGSEKISPDYYILNDIYGDKIVKKIRNGAKGKGKIRIFIDHVVPSDCPETDAKHVQLREFAREHQIEFEQGQGIAYSILLENGLQSGQVVAGCGSHISCCGAAGCIPLCVSPDKLAEAIGSDELDYPVPEAYIIELKGKMKYEGEIRSIAFWLQNQELPKDKALFFFCGDGCQMSIDDRADLCAAMGESGAAAVSFIPDKIWKKYEKEHDTKVDQSIDLSVIEPMAAGPFEEKARPLRQIRNLDIKSVFIGGCMGGTYSDVKMAAEFMRGKVIAPNLRALVVPNSQRVYLQAIEEGLVNYLEDSGVMVMNPQCSACWGKAQGHIMDDEAAVTTGYKTCGGCLGGQKSKVYAVSTRTALECVVTGQLGGGI